MKILDSIIEGRATGKKARLAARGVLNDLNRIPDSDMDEELIGKEARLWYPWIQAMKNVKATYKALLDWNNAQIGTEISEEEDIPYGIWLTLLSPKHLWPELIAHQRSLVQMIIFK